MEIALKHVLSVLILPLLVVGIARADAAGPLLLRSPSLSATQIAFGYGGQIWVVGRDGGEAHRLVSAVGRAGGPIFSPDGSMVGLHRRLRWKRGRFMSSRPKAASRAA